MICREIKNEVQKILDMFDWFNDYQDTRDWAASAYPHILPILDSGYNRYLYNKKNKLYNGEETGVVITVPDIVDYNKPFCSIWFKQVTFNKYFVLCSLRNNNDPVKHSILLNSMQDGLSAAAAKECALDFIKTDNFEGINQYVIDCSKLNL